MLLLFLFVLFKFVLAVSFPLCLSRFVCIKQPSLRTHCPREIWKHKMSSLTHPSLKTLQSLVDLFQRITQSGKSRCDVIAFSVHTKTLTKPAFSNFSGLKSIFEKLRFCDGLPWTCGANRRNKAVFSNASVWAWSSRLNDCRYEICSLTLQNCHLADRNALGIRYRLMYSKASARVKLSNVKPRFEFATLYAKWQHLSTFCGTGKRNTWWFVFERQLNDGNNFSKVIPRNGYSNTREYDKNTGSSWIDFHLR